MEKRELNYNLRLAVRALMTNSAKKKRIAFMFAGGMALGLLFASVSFITWQRHITRSSLFYLTASQAKLISSNVKCSLSFNDMKDANDILDSLKTQNYIVFAGIYDCNGRLFAYYYRNGVKKQDIIPVPPSKAKFKYHKSFLVVSEPVIDQHQLMGTVCLWAQQ